MTGPLESVENIEIPTTFSLKKPIERFYIYAANIRLIKTKSTSPSYEKKENDLRAHSTIIKKLMRKT